MGSIKFRQIDELLKYNPETGDLTWKTNRSNQVILGQKAGCTSDRYRRVAIKGKPYQAHRVAWLLYYGEWPSKDIDHINGDTFDNRIVNLREATATENQQNAKLRIDNKSKVTGLNWHKQCSKWQVNITVNKKLLYLGIFKDWFDAICARKAAEHKYGFHPNHGRR